MRRNSSRTIVVLLCAALALTAGALVVLIPGGAGAQVQRQAATSRVIVVLKNQESGLPASASDVSARQNAEASLQAPLASQMTSSGATNVHRYTLINAISATVSSTEESQLRANPSVSEVVPDEIIHLASPTAAGSAAGTGAAPAASGLCPAPGKTELAPEALSLMHVDSDSPYARTAHSVGITGTGVKVGFIADGLDTSNPDFIRANGQHVFVDYKDFTGEGTGVPTGGAEAFGDASSIAAQGREKYNIATFGPNAVKQTCDIRIEGVAPGVSLVGLDVFGAEDAGFNSTILDAIDYAVSTDHVNVLNESFGGNDDPAAQGSLDLIDEADQQAVAAGTTVVASTGDAGINDTIGSPADDPAVLSVGATTQYRAAAQGGFEGSELPGITGYLDNNIADFSSSGYEQDGRTIDAVAPGAFGWALCSTDVSMYGECTNNFGKPTSFFPFGGTSESSPLTAGVAALVDQAYKKTHGTFPTPAVVKQIILGTASDIGAPAELQGAGLVNAYSAVLAAESYKAPASAPTPVGNSLLESVSQLHATDKPDTPETLSDTITNTGSSTQKVALSGQMLGAYRTVDATTVTLNDSSSPKVNQGTENDEVVKFQVPAGESRLNAVAAWQGSPGGAGVEMAMVDPHGNLANTGAPDGGSNLTQAQITNPTPGTWTVNLYSPLVSDGGVGGAVRFNAGVAAYLSVGSVSPSSLTLAPGQSQPITLNVTTPATPGDYAGSIVLRSNVSGVSKIPVTVRSLIPTGSESFGQTLTGGNGRAFFTGQTFYYQLDVPSGQPELNASIELADNPNNPFTAFLVSPSGEAVATGANEIANGDSETNTLGTQLHVLAPVQGAWTLIVVFAPQVSGTATSEPFTVSTNQQKVPASAVGDPTASTKLTAGKSVTVDVTVKNNGPSTEEYFVDPRLSKLTQLPLTALTGPDTTVPFTFSSNFPEFVVPTDTSGFSETASTNGKEPIEFDSSPANGDPDIGSTVGLSVTASHSASPVTQGIWSIIPDVTGAYGTNGTTSESVATRMSVTTAAFDPTVSSPTGDLWLASTHPGVVANLSPDVVGPGQTVTIPVRITPKGASGTKVSGTLYVDDESEFFFQVESEPNGDQVAAIPYSYTIK